MKIIGGSGNYQISLSDEKLAVAQIENNEINIRALLTGCVTLTVTDENGQTALLNIIIISKILDSDKPRFVWCRREWSERNEGLVGQIVLL